MVKVAENHFLRKQWTLDKPPKKDPKKNYIPSHKRKGFDESKVIKLPTYPHETNY